MKFDLHTFLEHYQQAVRIRIERDLHSQISPKIGNPLYGIASEVARKFRAQIARYDKKARSRWKPWHRFLGWVFNISKKRRLLALYDFTTQLGELKQDPPIPEAIRKLSAALTILKKISRVWVNLLRPIRRLIEKKIPETQKSWADYLVDPVTKPDLYIGYFDYFHVRRLTLNANDTDNQATSKQATSETTSLGKYHIDNLHFPISVDLIYLENSALLSAFENGLNVLFKEAYSVAASLNCGSLSKNALLAPDGSRLMPVPTNNLRGRGHKKRARRCYAKIARACNVWKLGLTDRGFPAVPNFDFSAAELRSLKKVVPSFYRNLEDYFNVCPDKKPTLVSDHVAMLSSERGRHQRYKPTTLNLRVFTKSKFIWAQLRASEFATPEVRSKVEAADSQEIDCYLDMLTHAKLKKKHSPEGVCAHIILMITCPQPLRSRLMVIQRDILLLYSENVSLKTAFRILAEYSLSKLFEKFDEFMKSSREEQEKLLLTKFSLGFFLAERIAYTNMHTQNGILKAISCPWLTPSETASCLIAVFWVTLEKNSIIVSDKDRQHFKWLLTIDENRLLSYLQFYWQILILQNLYTPENRAKVVEMGEAGCEVMLGLLRAGRLPRGFVVTQAQFNTLCELVGKSRTRDDPVEFEVGQAILLYTKSLLEDERECIVRVLSKRSFKQMHAIIQVLQYLKDLGWYNPSMRDNVLHSEHPGDLLKLFDSIPTPSVSHLDHHARYQLTREPGAAHVVSVRRKSFDDSRSREEFFRSTYLLNLRAQIVSGIHTGSFSSEALSGSARIVFFNKNRFPPPDGMIKHIQVPLVYFANRDSLPGKRALSTRSQSAMLHFLAMGPRSLRQAREILNLVSSTLRRDLKELLIRHPTSDLQYRDSQSCVDSLLGAYEETYGSVLVIEESKESEQESKESSKEVGAPVGCVNIPDELWVENILPRLSVLQWVQFSQVNRQFRRIVQENIVRLFVLRLKSREPHLDDRALSICENRDALRRAASLKILTREKIAALVKTMFVNGIFPHKLDDSNTLANRTFSTTMCYQVFLMLDLYRGPLYAPALQIFLEVFNRYYRSSAENNGIPMKKREIYNYCCSHLENPTEEHYIVRWATLFALLESGGDEVHRGFILHQIMRCAYDWNLLRRGSPATRGLRFGFFKNYSDQTVDPSLENSPERSPPATWSIWEHPMPTPSGA